MQGDTRNCRKTQQSLRRHASHEVAALKTYMDWPPTLPEILLQRSISGSATHTALYGHYSCSRYWVAAGRMRRPLWRSAGFDMREPAFGSMFFCWQLLSWYFDEESLRR